MADVEPEEWWIKENVDSDSLNDGEQEKETIVKDAKRIKTVKRKANIITTPHAQKSSSMKMKSEPAAKRRRSKKKHDGEDRVGVDLFVEDASDGSYIELVNKFKLYIDQALTALERETVSDIRASHILVRKHGGDDIEDEMRHLVRTSAGPGEEPVASPVILLVAASALRCIELRRLLCEVIGEEKKNKTYLVAKLFAKHMKVKEQVTYLRKHRDLFAAVGTPQRLIALMDEGVLNLLKTKYVVFDWCHHDVKRHRLMDMDGLRSPLFTLLYREVLHTSIDRNLCHIVLL